MRPEARRMRTISIVIPMSSLVRVVVGEGICAIEMRVWIIGLGPGFSLVKT